MRYCSALVPKIIPTTPFQLHGFDVPSETEISLRNLGAYLDSGLTMEEHVRRVSASCYALRVLRKARLFIPHHTLITLAVQLILTKLDYYNSLLTNVSNKTLRHCKGVFSVAARLISGSRTSEHISPL